jgi:hypothetical protein
MTLLSCKAASSICIAIHNTVKSKRYVYSIILIGERQLSTRKLGVVHAGASEVRVPYSQRVIYSQNQAPHPLANYMFASESRSMG